MKRPPTPSVPSRRLRVSAIGIAGTALVHALLVLPIVLNLSLPPPHLPNHTGAGASAVVSSQEPVITAFFINNEVSPVERPPTVDPEQLASRGIAPKDLAVVVFSPDSSPASDADPKSEDSSAPPEAAGDAKQHALLYGRYLGQVQARIDRAWVRPRTEIGAPRFTCRAQIEQDRQRDVVNVKLDHCNGSQRWRQSLLSAIRTASPLPAPPDPSVYADILSLGFESEGFKTADPEDGFEPVNKAVLLANQESERLEHFAERAGTTFELHGKQETGVVHLTIVGEPNRDHAPSEPPAQSSSTQHEDSASTN